ncbi:hypothetical protein J4G48_0015245 [Bradyrhizobium barranii subsp. apii]|uniref:hypothetical protein n=1 Tax=Bradyrhizobium barranii TaxID=2992140 RepID=UPI001AA16773|nr:hypothetical protein [Bradyrhizobium barranii]UPT99319.1 hypothetical protein J4G48_0015245 [Bradyrhizobium barranii subsp. apii]
MLTRYVATFSNGETITSPSRCNAARTHAWLARGRLASGKAWSMSGFSRTGELNARKAMANSTSHLHKTEGVTFEIEEVQPATAIVKEAVAA